MKDADPLEPVFCVSIGVNYETERRRRRAIRVSGSLPSSSVPEDLPGLSKKIVKLTSKKCPILVFWSP